MHILLTDALACPRCGPGFGLVVLADRIEERRVVEGHLGCPNCRSRYPVRGRVADLRLGAPASPDPVPGADSLPGGEEAALRLAALMGVAGASGMALVAGPGSAHAAAVSDLVPELEVIAVSALPGGEREPGVSRVLASGAALPIRGGMRAVALTGGADDAWLREGLRVLAPGARLVADPAPADAAQRLRALGAEVLLADDGVVVARAPGRPVELRYNAVR